MGRKSSKKRLNNCSFEKRSSFNNTYIMLLMAVTVGALLMPHMYLVIVHVVYWVLMRNKKIIYVCYDMMLYEL